MWKPFAKAAPPREATDAPVQPHIMHLNSGVGVAVVKWNAVIAAEQAMRHPIVYRALDKLALSVQQVRWVVQKDPNASAAEQSGKETFIKDLQAVLDNPNDQMTAEMLRYWMTLNYATSGRLPLKFGVNLLKPKLPSGIYPLESRMVTGIVNSRGTYDSYKYGLTDSAVTYPNKRTFDKKPTASGYVEQIWKPGLKGYQSADDINSPMTAVALPAKVITALLIRAIQTAEGHPNVRYMVTCSKTLTQPQLETLKSHLDEHGMEGADAGKIPVLQNAGDIEIHTIDNDLSDIHSKMPSDDMARLIFGAFGIPIALAGIGAADAAKFAGNYDGSRASFWQDTVIPAYVTPLFGGLSSILCPPGVRIWYEEASIPALMMSRIAQMKEAVAIDFLTTNEKRAMFDLPETTEIPATTANKTTVASNGDTNANPTT